MKIAHFIAFCIIVSLGACENHLQMQLEVIQLLEDSVKQQYAPDGRVAIFKPKLTLSESKWKLSGISDQPQAIAVFLQKLKKKGLEIVGTMTLLPDQSVGQYSFAQVNNSVANLRSKNQHSAELASQASLGEVLKVLKRTEEWYLVQSLDQYISWVDHGGVVLKSNNQIDQWKNKKKIIIINNIGTAYTDRSMTVVVSDVVLGNILEWVATLDQVFEVKFPDGRQAFIATEIGRFYDEWKATLKPSGELVEQYALSMMGLPYLWGGTSAKGVDCSGFTKTVFFMNGLIIPRDASQQINEGEVVDQTMSFDSLKKGDLMFFGKQATDTSLRRVLHVAIWLDNGNFIHASQKVRMSSIDSLSLDYDEFNKNRYLGSRRYLLN